MSNLDVALSSFWQLARHWQSGKKAKLELTCEDGSLNLQLWLAGLILRISNRLCPRKFPLDSPARPRKIPSDPPLLLGLTHFLSVGNMCGVLILGAISAVLIVNYTYYSITSSLI